MRFFCCSDENGVAVGSRVVGRREASCISVIIEAWTCGDKVDFKKIDDRIEHTGGWHRQGELWETVVSIPKISFNEIMHKLKTTDNTGIIAVANVKTNFGIFHLEQELKTAKAIKADDDAARQNAMQSRSTSRSAI